MSNCNSSHINKELENISKWLILNKLSLNIKKSKFMVFHMPQKKIIYPTLFIDNVNIDCVDEFNFLGIIIHKHLTWNSHTNMIASKISSTIGVLNKLKHHFPPNILEMIYNSLIPCAYITVYYCGATITNKLVFYKKAIRIITLSNYLAHSEPLFRRLNKLTIEDIFTLNQLKFCFKLINKKLPDYFKNINLVKCRDTHRHDTRNKNRFHTWKVSHVFAEKCIRFSVPHILNNTIQISFIKPQHLRP